jgi:hypothetical protein
MDYYQKSFGLKIQRNLGLPDALFLGLLHYVSGFWDHDDD